MAKLTRKLQEMKEHRQTRSNSDENDFMLTITFNLLRNLANRNNFIHSLVVKYQTEQRKLDTNLTVATGLYVCSLITCWETFFRDLFVFICNTDALIAQRLKTVTALEIPLDLSIGEFYAGKYNFQNLNQTREALYPSERTIF